MANQPAVEFSIAKVTSTGEYKILYKEQSPSGKFITNEAKSYYTNDPEDAVLTLREEIINALGSGRSFKLGSKYTLELVNKYSKSKRKTQEYNILGGEGSYGK